LLKYILLFYFNREFYLLL